MRNFEESNHHNVCGESTPPQCLNGAKFSCQGMWNKTSYSVITTADNKMFETIKVLTFSANATSVHH